MKTPVLPSFSLRFVSRDEMLRQLAASAKRKPLAPRQSKSDEKGGRP